MMLLLLLMMIMMMVILSLMIVMMMITMAPPPPEVLIRLLNLTAPLTPVRLTTPPANPTRTLTNFRIPEHTMGRPIRPLARVHLILRQRLPAAAACYTPRVHRGGGERTHLLRGPKCWQEQGNARWALLEGHKAIGMRIE
jgi:hypothetical protein